MASSGTVVTYRQLDEGSRRLAGLLHRAGLRRGDHMTVLMENDPRYFEVCWAGLRSGLYVTPINWHLKADEVAYILEDCGASAIVTSHGLAELAQRLSPRLGDVSVRLALGEAVAGFDAYDDAVGAVPSDATGQEVEGTLMFYSSGTTGRPKGIKRDLPETAFGDAQLALVERMRDRYGFSESSVYLSPAPLYHAAPMAWSTSLHRIGGTVVMMEQFDPTNALELIERFRVTHAQFVPTHFVRMLKLPAEQRNGADLSSLRVVVHAAAPCPVEVKEQMMRWFGPIIHEYYAGSEANGTCAIGPQEWLTHKGSVGRMLNGRLHILDENGQELPPGTSGGIWFEGGSRFEYHNDPEKTRGAFNDWGWSTLGDIGYLDADGYLYLTDRASHMIISGGVNIYPQEVENVLILHPEVDDAAVIGVPHPDMGEQVKAVVQVASGSPPGPELEQTLILYCRERLAGYKCPRTVDFVSELPRLPTGKLLKRELRSRYWPADG
jgi:long-chain acyl-CoA synthetase